MNVINHSPQNKVMGKKTAERDPCLIRNEAAF